MKFSARFSERYDTNLLSWWLKIAGILTILYLFAYYILPPVQEMTHRLNKSYKLGDYADETNTPDLEKTSSDLKKSISRLQKQLDRFIPSSAYMTINTNENEFALYSKKTLIRQGICSTGSYILLHAGEDQQWIFKTPRGVRRVLNKQTNPVWSKPDWAFIEEGLPIPPPGHPSRYDAYALGEYKLDLGNGYMVHGTLYQRLLGKPVTHGCVRLGDDDLEEVYRSMSVGSKVFIY